jgi:hypothetical protein
MSELDTSPKSSAAFFRLSPALMALVVLAGCAQMQQQMQQPGYYNLPSASSTTDAIAQAEGSYANQSLRAPSQIQIDLRQPVAANAATAAAGGVIGSPVATQAAPQPVTAAKPVRAAAASTGTTKQGSANTYDGTGAPTDAPPADIGTITSAAASDTASANMLQSALIPEPQTFSGTLPCFHPDMKCTAERITLSLAPNGRWRARTSYLDQDSKSGPVQLDQGCWRVSPMNPPRVMLLSAQGNVRAELSMTAGNSLKLLSMNGETPNLTYTLSRQPDLDPIAELDKKTAPNCP